MSKTPKKKDYVTADEFGNIVSKLHAIGNFCLLSYTFFHLMKPDEAALLAFLNNQLILSKAVKKNNGWFRCSTDWIRKYLNFSKYQQERLVSSLVKRGFIEIRMKGNPAKRFIRINWTLLGQKIREVDPTWEDLDDESFF